MLKPFNKYLFLPAMLFAMAAHARSPVTMEDGTLVADCPTFASARQTLTVAENPRDAVAAADYLDCSLSWGGQEPGDINTLALIANALRAADIPTSLGPRITGQVTFTGLGARFDTSAKALSFTEDGQHVSLRFRRQKGDDYLLWVSDEILDAGYRAYFPVIVSWDGTSARVTPFYPGGF